MFFIVPYYRLTRIVFNLSITFCFSKISRFAGFRAICALSLICWRPLAKKVLFLRLPPLDLNGGRKFFNKFWKSFKNCSFNLIDKPLRKYLYLRLPLKYWFLTIEYGFGTSCHHQVQSEASCKRCYTIIQVSFPA